MENITCSFSFTITRFEGVRKESFCDLWCFPLSPEDEKDLIKSCKIGISLYKDDGETFTISAELRYKHNGLYNQLTVNTHTATLDEDVEKLVKKLLERLNIAFAVHTAIDSMSDNIAAEDGHPELSPGKYDPMRWMEYMD